MMMNEELLARILTRLEGIQASLDRAENERIGKLRRTYIDGEPELTVPNHIGVLMFSCFTCRGAYFNTEEQLYTHEREAHFGFR